jgi:esterase FrsA
VLGGPIEAAFTGGPPRHFGMAGIVGNAMGFDEPPSVEELVERRKAFSLRPLLNQDHNAPMLVINGADDVHVPQHDMLVFQGRRDTMVELIPGTGHCAASKLPQAMATIADWLEHTLAAATTRVALR